MPVLVIDPEVVAVRVLVSDCEGVTVAVFVRVSVLEPVPESVGVPLNEAVLDVVAVVDGVPLCKTTNRQSIY